MPKSGIPDIPDPLEEPVCPHCSRLIDHGETCECYYLSKTENSAMDPAYEAWLARVDSEVMKICGMSYMDLPDYNYRDAFTDEESPEDVARCVVIEAGGGFLVAD